MEHATSMIGPCHTLLVWLDQRGFHMLDGPCRTSPTDDGDGMDVYSCVRRLTLVRVPLQDESPVGASDFLLRAGRGELQDVVQSYEVRDWSGFIHSFFAVLLGGELRCFSPGLGRGCRGQ